MTDVLSRMMQYTRDVSEVDGCWTWTGKRDEKGYGRIKIRCEDGVWRPHGAHRVSWEAHNGPIPGGLWVLHRCDNPPCINPNHLFLGTAADNTADMMQKGRWKPGIARGDKNGAYTKPDRVLRGSRVGTSKLSEAEVFAIKRAIDDGEPHAEIAGRYDVSRALISQIGRGERWSHVS